MWLTAAIVVVFFLAIVATLIALAQRGPELWATSVEKAHGRRAPRRETVLMVRQADVQDDEEHDGSRCSYAVEQDRERPGTVAPGTVPDLVEQLGALDDNELLEVLALLKTEDGWRFAESRIAKFIPGRDQDRLDQVLAVRGVQPPAEPEPAPGRALKVRDARGERLISY